MKATLTLWVMSPVTKILAGLASSMSEFRSIQPGQECNGYKCSTGELTGESH